MCFELPSHAVLHAIQINTHALSTRKLERWHQVAIAGHDDNRRNKPIQSQSRYVQSDAQIDALLLDMRHKVVRSDGPFTVKLLQSLAADLPSMAHRFTHTKCHIWH